MNNDAFPPQENPVVSDNTEYLIRVFNNVSDNSKRARQESTISSGNHKRDGYCLVLSRSITNILIRYLVLSETTVLVGTRFLLLFRTMRPSDKRRFLLFQAMKPSGRGHFLLSQTMKPSGRRCFLLSRTMRPSGARRFLLLKTAGDGYIFRTSSFESMARYP